MSNPTPSDKDMARAETTIWSASEDGKDFDHVDFELLRASIASLIAQVRAVTLEEAANLIEQAPLDNMFWSEEERPLKERVAKAQANHLAAKIRQPKNKETK